MLEVVLFGGFVQIGSLGASLFSMDPDYSPVIWEIDFIHFNFAPVPPVQTEKRGWAGPRIPDTKILHLNLSGGYHPNAIDVGTWISPW